jgi:DNA-binding NtrC family response regulator
VCLQPVAGLAPALEASVRSSADIDCSRVRGWSVAVVEDDPVVAKSIELSLQAVGISVRHFFSAEEAMESPSLLDADFYISDFVLPGRNGIELLDAIRQRSGQAINAVLMTGETSPERMELAKTSEWKILIKPAGLANLLSVMNEVAAAEGVGK